MTPERLQQIRLVYEHAMGMAPARRAAYLDEACAGDAELRREVESLFGSGGRRRASKSSSRKRARRREEHTPLEVVPGRTTLGAYRVLEKIGAGGMGTVYLAKDVRLGRRVALKVLPAQFARDEELVRRFEQEARAVAALNHPNILTLHEIGEEGGRLFIVTEYVEGSTLRERMWEERFDPVAALDVCAQVAGALAKAHAAGVVHRDIKPENLMLDEEGHVKVLDFGIAKQVAAAPSVDTSAPTNAHVNTASGVVLGTTTYMSPEQVRGLDLDGRTDVWSLGCVLYEMLAGRPPFEEKNFGDLVVSILHSEPPPLAAHAADVPEEVEPLILRALAKERDERFQTAREFQTELRRVRRLLELRAGDAELQETVQGAASQPLPTHAPTRPRRQAGEALEPARGAAGERRAAKHTSEQRKQLTVLFGDVAGLAALTEGQDAEDVGELMGALWPVVDSVVERHGGEVTKHVGETFVALWGARGAREDDPERAVLAALDAQAAVADFVAAWQPQEEPRAQAQDTNGTVDVPNVGEGGEAERLMRIGVSTGLVLLGQVETTGELSVTGDSVRLASRLQQESPVGGVLISHDTYRHVRGVFDVNPPETLQTGGRSDPVQFYRVLRAKARAFRVRTRGVEGVETRMIGRKGELRRLTDALESVFEEGELQVVTLIGDAGLGKSRLLYEFSNWVELLPDMLYVFNGRAGESAQGLPYALVRDVLSFRFEIQDSDPPQVAREKLERGMVSMCPDAPESDVLMWAHFIGQLIGFDYSSSPHVSGIRDDARQVRDRAFRYAARFFSDISRDYTVVLYLDDIHWADDGSLDFIDHLARNCAHVSPHDSVSGAPTVARTPPRVGRGARAPHARHAPAALEEGEPPARRGDSSARARRPARAARAGRGRRRRQPVLRRGAHQDAHRPARHRAGRRRVERGRDAPRRSAGAADADGRASGATRPSDAGGEDRLAARLGHRARLLGRRSRAPRRGRDRGRQPRHGSRRSAGAHGRDDARRDGRARARIAQGQGACLPSRGFGLRGRARVHLQARAAARRDL